MSLEAEETLESGLLGIGLGSDSEDESTTTTSNPKTEVVPECAAPATKADRTALSEEAFQELKKTYRVKVENGEVGVSSCPFVSLHSSHYIPPQLHALSHLKPPNLQLFSTIKSSNFPPHTMLSPVAPVRASSPTKPHIHYITLHRTNMQKVPPSSPIPPRLYRRRWKSDHQQARSARDSTRSGGALLLSEVRGGGDATEKGMGGCGGQSL